MVETLKLFLSGVSKKLYVKLTFLLCGLPSLVLPFIKTQLPKTLQEYNLTVVLVLIMIFLIIMPIASFEKYHELRTKRINDVYRFVPEALKGKVFRDLFDLYKEGEFLKNGKAGTERMQKWDEEIILFLTSHFQNICKNNYLMATGRVFAPPRILPINDNRFNDAVSYIKGLLYNNFNQALKV
jgi:hypothetical protein